MRKNLKTLTLAALFGALVYVCLLYTSRCV